MSSTALTPSADSSARPTGAQRRAVLFTQQFLAPGARKTGMIFWSESLAKLGWDTSVVTVQLSLLSVVAGVARLNTVPPSDLNVWRERGRNLRSFVWRAPLHPARLGPRWIDAMTGVLARLYPWFLPETVRAALREADLVVIESCAAVALFDAVRRLAPPGARIVYCASDRLASVGMHPILSRILAETAARYDLVRVPARSLLTDFPSDAKAEFIPHGVDKEAFDRDRPSPYRPGSRNVVVAGDMMFDRETVAALVRDFPDLTFHAFGRMDCASFADAPNVVVHGEVPFEVLADYLVHADLGLAPYIDRQDLNYLSESSLKLRQYTYCRLPIVAPRFAVAGLDHGYGYGGEVSATGALRAALRHDRATIDRSRIMDWVEVMRAVLSRAGLDGPGA
jgi:2-beta-glucuronyltransferase